MLASKLLLQNKSSFLKATRLVAAARKNFGEQVNWETEEPLKVQGNVNTGKKALTLSVG